MAANFNLHDVTVPFVVVQLRVIAYDSDRTNGVETVKVSIPVHHASRHDIHKVTHLHPSGIVSYAMLRAPSSRAMCSPNIQGAPIMVLLHGAGVEAENALVKKAFDAVPEICAWILMPSGVTTWSGDDWRRCTRFIRHQLLMIDQIRGDMQICRLQLTIFLCGV